MASIIEDDDKKKWADLQIRKTEKKKDSGISSL